MFLWSEIHVIMPTLYGIRDLRMFIHDQVSYLALVFPPTYIRIH